MKQFYIGLDSFEDTNTRKTTIIEIPGWKQLKIQYAIQKMISGKPHIIWNVIGTNHVFRIPLMVITEHHGGNYEDHFKLTLQKFREDYLDWYSKKFPEPWMRNYWDFSNFIYKTK